MCAITLVVCAPSHFWGVCHHTFGVRAITLVAVAAIAQCRASGWVSWVVVAVVLVYCVDVVGPVLLCVVAQVVVLLRVVAQVVVRVVVRGAFLVCGGVSGSTCSGVSGGPGPRFRCSGVSGGPGPRFRTVLGASAHMPWHRG